MWCIFIFICFVLTNLSSSLPIITNHHQQNRSEQSIDLNNGNVSSDMCSVQYINIDILNNETGIQHSSSTTITILDINQFISFWERIAVRDDDDDDHSVSLNIIEIIFTIPYKISNESIINKTVLITDVIHNHLLASLTNICFNESSFFINYSTIQPLPHNICLYLLLNLTLSMTSLKEIIFCRMIEDFFNNTSSSGDTGNNPAVGPSEFFILSQCVIILIMMFIIYGVQTARQKSLVNRVSQRLTHSRPYIIIFGNKTGSDAVNHPRNSATTLQAGLNRVNFHHQLIKPIEEQVLAANDLTSTINDRRATRASINRDLIDVKEFTKRMSLTNENNSTDIELHSI